MRTPLIEKTATVWFDGEIIRPEGPIDMTPNMRYTIRFEPAPPVPPTHDEDAWDVLERLAGTIEAPPDWSEEHDDYIYGTPKINPRVDS